MRWRGRKDDVNWALAVNFLVGRRKQTGWTRHQSVSL